MRILRRADYRRMPWKNGQGLTEEVAAFPQGSSVEDFHWRISIAHVGVDGPFSVFPGIDRTIALLDGDGLVLDLPDGTAQTLRPDGDPFPFPGEWIISSRNASGPTVDLNIMTRRGRYRHRLMRRRLGAGEAFSTATPSAMIVTAPTVLHGPDGAIGLERFDCVMLEADERVTVPDAADVLIAELLPLS